MKIPNPKNRRQQGWVLILIGVILVVGMAGVLSVGLYSCAKRHMPESTANPTGLPTNIYIWHQVITNTVSTNGTPTNPPSPRALSLPVVARGFNFGLQYGVDSAGAGWVAAGQAQPASPALAQEDVLIRNVEFNPNGEACMDLFTSWGEVWHVEGDKQTLTGYWTPPNPEGVTVIVQRTDGDFITWTSLLTNSVLPGSVWNFTDTNGAADAGFYRLQLP